MGLKNNHLSRRCGAEDEISSHTVCEYEALASLRYTYLVSFSLDAEDIKSISLGPSGNLVKENCSLELLSIYGAQGAPFIRPRYIGTARARTQLLIN